MKAPLPARRERLRESHDSNKENVVMPRSAAGGTSGGGGVGGGSDRERYIQELVREGYERGAVVLALDTAHNDMTMARNILHSFVPRT